MFVFVLSCLGVLAFTPVLATDNALHEPERKGRGFSYVHEEDPKIPLSIHVLKFERSRPDFEVHSTLAKGATIGLGTMTEQTKAWPLGLGKPIAAINGDFWKDGRYDGDPEGLQIMRGELISAPGERACFWIDTNGQPHVTNVLSQMKVIWPNDTSTPIGLNEERTDRGRRALYTCCGTVHAHKARTRVDFGTGRRGRLASVAGGLHAYRPCPRSSRKR
jgi:hypothetical protein